MTRKPTRIENIEYAGNTGRPVRYTPAVRREEASPVYMPPQLTILDHIFTSKRDRKRELAQIEFEKAIHSWEERQGNESDRVDHLNLQRQKVLDSEQKDWEVAEAKYKQRQDSANAEVDALRRNYEQWNGEDVRAIEEHAELVLNGSQYPDWIEVDFDLGYNIETKTIIVDYRLPQEASIPTAKKRHLRAGTGRVEAEFSSPTREGANV